MSEIQELDVIIAPDGTVKVEVRGVKGRKCLDITKDFEELLGGNISERVYTDEFDQQELDQFQESSLTRDRS